MGFEHYEAYTFVVEDIAYITNNRARELAREVNPLVERVNLEVRTSADEKWRAEVILLATEKIPEADLEEIASKLASK